ncbi:MAG TPA: hypothetical protein VEP46_01245 [Vicinamibacterales bacterium]|nr:hypothetical protein [Vicinamibacterales bacterium]
MHAVLALFVMALPIGAPRSATDAQCVDNQLTVTAQIHDYWHVSRESLAGASDVVARLYERIGVRIDWYPTVKKDVRHPGSAVGREPSRVPVAKLTVIVLTPEMAARAHIQDDVLGFAAVPEEGMGRIAYVIYDRVQRIAAGHGADEVGLLGSVMAHEISHLLLGRGSHVGGGLMKDHWNHLDVRQLASLKLEFSESQADHIRRTIEGDSRSTTVLARDAAASPMEACLARRPVDSALEPAP